jgi:DNA repair exonuclease SbcCD nuclease subunit
MPAGWESSPQPPSNAELRPSTNEFRHVVNVSQTSSTGAVQNNPAAVMGSSADVQNEGERVDAHVLLHNTGDDDQKRGHEGSLSKSPEKYNGLDKIGYDIKIFHDLLPGVLLSNNVKSDTGIDKSHVDKSEYDIVIGGDNHRHQKLDLEHTVGYYIGAPCQHKWVDSGHKRGFMYLELWKNDNGKTQHRVEFIESSAPKFIKFSMNITKIEDLLNLIESKKDEWKNNIIRIELSSTSSTFTGITPNQLEDSIKTVSKARSVKVKFNYTDATPSQKVVAIKSDKEHWEDFMKLKKEDLKGVDVDALIKLGYKYL